MTRFYLSPSQASNVLTTSRRTYLASCAAVASLGLVAACSGSVTGAGGSGGGGGAGGLLAFGGEGDIFVMRPDGKGRKQLTKVPSGTLARDPAWSADGSKVLYAYSPPLPNVRGPGGLLPLPVTDL